MVVDGPRITGRRPLIYICIKAFASNFTPFEFDTLLLMTHPLGKGHIYIPYDFYFFRYQNILIIIFVLSNCGIFQNIFVIKIEKYYMGLPVLKIKTSVNDASTEGDKFLRTKVILLIKFKMIDCHQNLETNYLKINKFISSHTS